MNERSPAPSLRLIAAVEAIQAAYTSRDKFPVLELWAELDAARMALRSDASEKQTTAVPECGLTTADTASAEWLESITVPHLLKALMQSGRISWKDEDLKFLEMLFVRREARVLKLGQELAHKIAETVAARSATGPSSPCVVEPMVKELKRLKEWFEMRDHIPGAKSQIIYIGMVLDAATPNRT